MRRAWWLVLLGVWATGCAAGSGATDPAGKEGSVVTLDGLKSSTPADWKSEKPSSKLRTYQFRLPRFQDDKEDAELVIFYFGAGAGGSVRDNLKRWKDQFQPPQGKTTDEVAKVEEFDVGKVKVTYLDIHGTYLSKSPVDPNAKVVRKEDYRRFGVIFESPNGPYFITLTGPIRTLEQHKQAFDGWLKNFK
jgi:hypothetical protein